MYIFASFFFGQQIVGISLTKAERTIRLWTMIFPYISSIQRRFSQGSGCNRNGMLVHGHSPACKSGGREGGREREGAERVRAERAMVSRGVVSAQVALLIFNNYHNFGVTLFCYSHKVC